MQIAVVEIAKAVHLVDRRDRVAEPRHDLRRQLEAEIHALGADVEQEIAGRGDRMTRSGLDFAERMQFGRPRLRRTACPTRPIRIAITQERFPSMSRKPTARSSAGRSPQNDRTTPRLAAPGFIVTTRKIAARVSDCATACGTTGGPFVSAAVKESDST